MHFPLLTATTFLLPLTTAAALTRRCSPAYDPDLALGYVPPAPCWQTFDPACQPHLAAGTEMTVDARHGVAVVYGGSASCAAQIAEEPARGRDGRKNYGWVQKHGWLTVVEPHGSGGQRFLVISEMRDEVVERYAKLTYK